MYNLNVNLATAASAVNSLLSVESACTTPRTPEIVNSLIAMTTNPLDYTFGEDAPKKRANAPITSMSSDSNSSSCSQLESPTNAPLSVQHTCSQLIKAGLKLSIEQKRKLQSDGEDILDLDQCKRIKKNESESEEDKINVSGLTPEDEERRRRRRERNKIAATKCRLKKRERTANLVTESETLETQNIDLKSQIQELEKTRSRLVEVLALHRPHCQKDIPIIRENTLTGITSISCARQTAIHSYNNRPSSIDINYQNIEMYNRPTNNGEQSSYNRNNLPSIIIDGPIDSYEPQLTNLDNPVSENMSFNFNHQQQCHNYNSSQNYGNSGMDNGCMA